MKYFYCLVWISLMLLSIYAVNVYMEDTNNRKNSQLSNKLQTQCLKWPDVYSNQRLLQGAQNSVKFCVHCLKGKSFRNQKYPKSAFSFKVKSQSRQNYQPSLNINILKLLHIEKSQNFECSQYLNFIDTGLSQLDKDQIIFQQNKDAHSILKILKAESFQIHSAIKQNNEIMFQFSGQNAQQLVLFHKIITPSVQTMPTNPSQASVHYLNRLYFVEYFKSILNVCLFFLFLISMLILILENKRNGRLDNYEHLLLGTILIYVFVYIYFYSSAENSVLYCVAWAFFIWSNLIKLDNVDKNSFNSSKLCYAIISILGGASMYISNRIVNKTAQISFWMIFLFAYLIFYKIVLRVCCLKRRFQNDATISSLVYLIIVVCLIIESVVIEQFYRKLYFRQTQISRYALIMIAPLILLIMTFCENQQKIQKFEEYTRNNSETEDEKIHSENS